MSYDPCLTWIRLPLRSPPAMSLGSWVHREQNRGSWNHFNSSRRRRCSQPSINCQNSWRHSTWAPIASVLIDSCHYNSQDKCTGRKTAVSWEDRGGTESAAIVSATWGLLKRLTNYDPFLIPIWPTSTKFLFWVWLSPAPSRHFWFCNHSVAELLEQSSMYRSASPQNEHRTTHRSFLSL